MTGLQKLAQILLPNIPSRLKVEEEIKRLLVEESVNAEPLAMLADKKGRDLEIIGPAFGFEEWRISTCNTDCAYSSFRGSSYAEAEALCRAFLNGLQDRSVR